MDLIKKVIGELIINFTNYLDTSGIFATAIDEESIILSENLNLTAQWRTLSLGETAVGENQKFTDTAGQTATIPKNFTVSGISSEATIAGGLVIYDLEGNTVSNWNLDSDSNGILDVQESYNQFVWIPLSGTLTRYEGYAEGGLQSFLSSCSEPCTSGYSTEISEYNAMKNSVESNHGFYMARYEAAQGSNGKVESKKGKTVWNNIAWGDSLVDVGTTGAVYQSQQMYKNKSGYNVTSTLVYGAQWDTMCVFIDPKYATNSCDNDSVLFDSSSYGNYNHRGGLPNPFVTGVRELKNLYDIAANAWEYTMEYRLMDDSTARRIVRGGYAESNGWAQPLSTRGTSKGTPQEYLGFRPVLYL